MIPVTIFQCCSVAHQTRGLTLLADLNKDTDHGPPENTVLHAENFGILGVTTLLVFLLLHADLVELDIDLVVVRRQATETGQVLAAVFPSLVLGEEAGRFGRKDETDEEEEGECELETGSHSPSFY